MATVAMSPEEIADRARLRYLPDDRLGIRRRRYGKGFSYAGVRGGRVSSADRERIRRLVIPPAWRDVWIAPEADAHLQATGFDDAGRKQYVYHERWREAADAAKFDRLSEFAPALTSLRRRVAADLRLRNGDVLLASAARLIDRCLIRPGSRRGSSVGDAVGATDLGPTEIRVQGGLIMLDFVGKSGVDHHVEVRDRQLARVISDLLDDSSPGRPLFSTVDGDEVDERRLNDYIHRVTESSFTAKDFRTWGASSIVTGELGPIEPATAEKGRAAQEREAIAAAADALGNTLAVCRSAYVAPAVLAAFETGALAEHWRRSRRGAWLSRAERTTSRVLADRNN